MNDHHRKGDDLVIELATELRTFMERYERDQEERDRWRASLDAKIDPVVRDHDLVMRGGKWFLGAGASLWGLIKGWFFLKDHLK